MKPLEQYNPFLKHAGALKPSYWENRLREELTRPEFPVMEPTTPVFHTAQGDTFSLAPLPLFEPEFSLEPLEVGSYFVPNTTADFLPADSDLDAGPEIEPAGPSIQPFLSDVFGLPKAKPQLAEEDTASLAVASGIVPKKSKQSRRSAVQDLSTGRTQPRRQAKDEHLLQAIALSPDLDLSSQVQQLWGSVQEPLSPRAADTKAGYKTRQQSRLTITQEPDLSSVRPVSSLSSLTSDAIRADVIALLESSPPPSEQTPAELGNKRAELKVKKALMLQEYASGQTDGPTLLTNYQLTPKQLRTWVLAFRREQEALGLHFPMLEWPRQKHTESSLKRNAETSEATLDSEYVPELKPVPKKSRKRLAFQNPPNPNNPFFRKRGEGGRFASTEQSLVPSEVNSSLKRP